MNSFVFIGVLTTLFAVVSTSQTPRTTCEEEVNETKDAVIRSSLESDSIFYPALKDWRQYIVNELNADMLCNDKIPETEKVLSSLVYLLVKEGPLKTTMCNMCQNIISTSLITDLIAGYQLPPYDLLSANIDRDLRNLCSDLIPSCSFSKSPNLSFENKAFNISAFACIECSLCKAGLEYLQYYIFVNPQPELEEAGKKLCIAFNDTLKTDCDVLGPTIVHGILNGLHVYLQPGQICPQVFPNADCSSPTADNLLLCAGNICQELSTSLPLPISIPFTFLCKHYIPTAGPELLT